MANDADIRYFLRKMPYTVRVGNIPGGMSEFITIQAAINYCVTQTPTAANRWTVLVWPGTYTENITMAQYVDVVGMDKEGVIIDTTNGTAVTMADDSRLSNLTVNALATNAGSAYCIALADAGCRVEDLNMYIDRDVTGGLECVGIIEDTAATVKTIYTRNVRIRCEQAVNSNTHGISIRQANKTLYIEESYVEGSDYGMAIGESGGQAVASIIWSKQNFFYATAAASRAVFCNGGEIWLHEDSLNRGCRFSRKNDGLIIYTDGNEVYHVFEGMSIQDTLDNIPVAGCEVRIHDGTYTITDPITFTQNNTLLVGDGPNTFIDGDGLATTEHAIVISGKTNCTVKNLRIQTQDGGGKVCHCIFVENGANGTHIEEVTIDDSDSDGIHLEGTTAYDISIHDITINGADGYGIYCDMDAANFLYRSHVSHCLILGTGSSGIYAGNTGSSYYCEINNNLVFQAGGQGIQALNMHHSDLSNNLCMDCTSDGIIIGTSDHCNLEGNQCWSSGGNGIEFATTVECVAAGNVCSANTNSGIELDGASNLNLVESNHCRDNTLDGIRCGGTRVSIEGNFCHENDQHGISLSNPDCLVNDNYCYDNSQGAAGTYHGINVGVDADRSQICGNHITDPGDATEDGVHLVDGAAQCQINGNFIYDMMGSGICLAANNLDTQINGNHCEACDDYGIEVLAGCDRSIVNNNKCYANGDHGVYVFRTDYCTVTGNVCNGNTGTADGIHVEGDATGNADYNTVSSNVCTGNADDGVEVAGGANANKNIVLGNQLLGNTGTALVDGGTNTEVASNITV